MWGKWESGDGVEKKSSEQIDHIQYDGKRVCHNRNEATGCRALFLQLDADQTRFQLLVVEGKLQIGIRTGAVVIGPNLARLFTLEVARALPSLAWLRGCSGCTAMLDMWGQTVGAPFPLKPSKTTHKEYHNMLFPSTSATKERGIPNQDNNNSVGVGEKAVSGPCLLRNPKPTELEG